MLMLQLLQNELFRKGRPAELEPFGDAQVSAFNFLVEAVTSPPVLALPTLGLPFEVDTDASKDQVGCALFQTSTEGERHPIGYCSRNLNFHEHNYSVSEKECLAVVWALATLRPYLMGRHFKEYTDHSALRWLMEITEPSGRLMRWRLRLAEFDSDILYKKGTLNTQADALSRLGTSVETEPIDDLEIPCFAVGEADGSAKIKSDDVCDDIPDAEPSEPLTGSFVPITPEKMIREQQMDPFCTQIRSRLNGGATILFWTDDQGYLARNVESNPPTCGSSFLTEKGTTCFTLIEVEFPSRRKKIVLDPKKGFLLACYCFWLLCSTSFLHGVSEK
ncbi:unnamed protein product [Agarophyton chilense]